jgi:NAD(P)-dependent dehydrogenase (short-subunit alcohol dehydrogenase family)
MGPTRLQSKEVGPSNIQINSIMPGAIATQRQDEVLTPEYRAEVMQAQSLQRGLMHAEGGKVIVFLAVTRLAV